jgi:hypothetical protein
MLMRCLETCHLLGISQHVNEETEILCFLCDGLDTLIAEKEIEQISKR